MAAAAAAADAVAAVETGATMVLWSVAWEAADAAAAAAAAAAASTVVGAAEEDGDSAGTTLVGAPAEVRSEDAYMDAAPSVVMVESLREGEVSGGELRVDGLGDGLVRGDC